MHLNQLNRGELIAIVGGILIGISLVMLTQLGVTASRIALNSDPVYGRDPSTSWRPVSQAISALFAALGLVARQAYRDAELARKELERSQRILPEAARQAVLGPGREALGEAKGAESVYLELLKDRPNDPGVKRTLAQFPTVKKMRVTVEGKPFDSQATDWSTPFPVREESASTGSRVHSEEGSAQ